MTAEPLAPMPPPAHSRTACWRALGTQVELAVTEVGALDDAVDLATALLDWVDRSCSRFRADSDLVRANARAGSWVRVDPLLAAAVEAAVHAAEVTGGLVDPTLGRVLALNGYDRDLDDVRADRVDPAAPRLTPAGPRPGAWRELDVDLDGGVRVPDGTALDLGAIGKAFAADLVAEELATVFGCGVIVGVGGDIAAAGPPPRTPDGPGWVVDVDVTPGSAVLIDEGGVATSSTQHRVWRHGGRHVHHLLDPATGRPVPVVWSEVTVRAGSCVDANAASTAAMVMGHAAPSWLDDAGLPARLRRADGEVRGTGGWPGVRSAARRRAG